MESNKYSYQRRMGEFLNTHIPPSILDKKNKEKSWVQGYNEDYDIVIISRDGTISQPYELQGVKICTPAIPEDISKIRGHNLHIEKQYWTPFKIPLELKNIDIETISWNSDKANKNNLKTPTEVFFMKPDSFVKKHLSFINADFDRRDNGLWQYVCGNPIYIPPSHYFMLQHTHIQGNRLPDFRFTNLDYWIFWEAIKQDHRSLGIIYLKNRRSGASTMAGAEAINIGTSIPEGFIGCVSKTNRDSASFLSKMVIRPFKKLVWYFSPVTSGTSSAASGLVFKEPPKKMSSKNTVLTAEGGLDTVIKQYPTSINSLDGERTDFVVLDEAGKFPTDVPFDQYWSVVEECLVEGFRVIGKCMTVSTVNAQAKGGKAYKDIYYASDVRKRMENGRTNTGLYSFFIPSEWNQDGGYCKYGYSILDDPIFPVKNREGQRVKKGNLSRLIEKGAALKRQSAVLYNDFLRKHPRTENHAFRDEASSSDFNLNLINEQLDHNEMFYKNIGGDDLSHEYYERGNFINIAKEYGEYEIEWVPSKYGRFFVSWMPDKKLRNNFEKRGGTLFPLNDFGCFGIDPYKFSKTTDNRGSPGAMHGSTGDSINLDMFPDNKFFLEYIHRPDTVEMFMTDMIYAMLFYGIPALIENNVPNLLERMKRDGLTGLALRRKDKKKLTATEIEFGGIPMVGEKVVQDHYFALQTYIDQHVGEAMSDRYRDLGQMGDVPFSRMLDSWTKFNPNNRTTQDASISSGLSRMGIKMMYQKNKNSTDEIQKQLFKGFYGNEYSYSKSDIGSLNQ